jgi:hypothetical protein
MEVFLAGLKWGLPSGAQAAGQAADYESDDDGTTVRKEKEFEEKS